jgi:G3E family GTPase
MTDASSNPTPPLPLSQNPVPATVFSGFLGSGKTTVIGHLIDDLQGQGVQVAYVKNEVGTDTIDEDIIRGKNILTKELLNGCICCTLVGNFHQALTEIVQTIQPDRILIEASGVSDPTAIALTLESHPLVHRDGVVTIIDVLNYNGVPVLNSVAQRQAEFTDLIIFNKVEKVTIERKQQVVGYVREVNTKAPIVEAPKGHIHPSLVFGLFPSDVEGQEKMLELKKIEQAQHEAQHADGVAHDESHLDEDHIESFTIESDEIYDAKRLITALSSLPQQVFRVKGFVKVKTNGGSVMMIVNGVNGQIELTAVPSDFHQDHGKLVSIGFLISQLQDDVKAALATAI